MMRKSFLFCKTLLVCAFLAGCSAASDNAGRALSDGMADSDLSSDITSAEALGDGSSGAPDGDSAGSAEDGSRGSIGGGTTGSRDGGSAGSTGEDWTGSSGGGTTGSQGGGSAGSMDGQQGSAYIYTTEGNIIPMSESAEADGITCQILACEATSAFGDRTLENLNYFYEADGIDDQGNLLNDKTYLFITFRYTNNSDAEIEFIRGTQGIYRLDEHLIVQDYTVDAVYIDEPWLGGTESETYHYRLKPGESVTSEIGYIVDRDFAQDSSHLYFALRQSDCMTDFGAATDPDAIFVKLECAK